VPKWVVTLAVAAIAALSLYVSAFGFFGPLSTCLRTVPTASAAPSPTCGGDLRECLRLSAKTGIYGARYVEADDVARCVEAFEACIHGGASAGGNQPPPISTSTPGGGGRRGLPEHFGITSNGELVKDCRVNGEAVTCETVNSNEPVEGFDSWSGGMTGTLSGMTVTGNGTIHIEGFVPGEPSCRFTQEGTQPVTYVFNSDGTVSASEGPLQWLKTFHGSCSGEESNTVPTMEWTATWSAIG
jgi:hypothetical protein